MAYQAPLAPTGLILPDPATIQAFETTNVNANFTRLNNAIITDRTAIAALDPVKAMLPAGATPGFVPAGSEAARDAYWGVPASGTARVALANKMPRWFNTLRGWEERYFAASTDSAVSGFKRATASRSGAGWFPVGDGAPYVMAVKNIAQNTAVAAHAITWRNTRTGALYDDHGYYSTGAAARIAIPSGHPRGLFTLHAQVRLGGAGGGSTGVALEARKNGVEWDRGRASAAGGTGAATQVVLDVPITMAPGDYVEVFATASAAGVAYSLPDCFVELQYLRPEPADA